MKRFTLTTVLFLMLFAVTLIAAGQEDDAVWSPVSETYLVNNGDAGTWNSTYNEPGDVVYMDGMYHLFTTGFPGFPAKSGIGYLTSEDGITYEWVSEEPVLTTDDVPYAKVAIDTSSVIVEEDGTWVLYFTVFNSADWPRVAGTIGRATAEDPAGEWTISEAPVLEASGEEDAWDEAMVAYPSVSQTGDGYRMYFVGQDSIGNERVGIAYSEDGITWEKDADPVFEPGGFVNFMITEVVFDGEQYVMVFKNSYEAVSLLTSEDGLTWNAEDAIEILHPRDFEGLVALGFISLTVTDDVYYLSYEGNTGTETQIYAVTRPIE